MHQAIDQGFDAFLNGNKANPDLLEARETGEFPVLDLGETPIGVMRTMGERFGLITINQKYRLRLEDVIRHSDAGRRLVGIYPMNFLPIFDLEAACQDNFKRGDLFRHI
ncbi:MAG: hypothetical protein ACJ0UT_08630 [Candidatus Latescibacterota bacterium]